MSCAPIELAKGGNFTDLIATAREQVDYTVSLDNVLYDGSPATAEFRTISI
jgi:hypothetical protein